MGRTWAGVNQHTMQDGWSMCRKHFSLVFMCHSYGNHQEGACYYCTWCGSVETIHGNKQQQQQLDYREALSKLW